MASNKDKSDTGKSKSHHEDQPDSGLDDTMAQGFAAFAQFSKTILEASTPDMMGANGPSPQNDAPNPDPLGLGADFSKVFEEMASNPETILKAQSALWQSYGALWSQTLARAAGKPSEEVVSPAPGDRRWQAPEWSENLMFDLIKQSYLLSANWLNDMVANVEGIDPQTRDKVAFFTRQMTDAYAPTNFAMTNPEVLRATVQSKGENLKKGMENFACDLQEGDGKLKIRQTDTEAFEIGKNIATTPGKVVFENEIMQLLQFSPTTKTVFKLPLVIFPPWINKYYILDLRPEQSMIRWLVNKGYSVFVVSWVNPDSALKDKSFEDYMQDGIFAALNAIKAATGEPCVNAVGYCIGGTLLAASLAYMAAKDDQRIATATFFAAQSDFSEAGDLRVFCDDAGLNEIERRMDEGGGILDGASMAEAFNLLRPNDLIWSHVISNYMLGQDPRPFDLLYWNADCTRMPKALHLQYLRTFYQKNAYAKGEMVLAGVKLDPASITIPMYIQSSREDHIAPANSVYRSARLYGGAGAGKVRFMMSGSGHIAGVINPPAAKKYQYWTNTALPAGIGDWKDGAEEHPGSWWPDWHNWLKVKSGKKVPARTPGEGALPAIENAPGRYVKVKS
ncbi:MAG: class I poly(R)-hydroxyalkanoic acid synthase [Robiginitomaculum sp.]|nr:MAG: class I poly(R)-hydroxyalkanoic acid synthase [Robiginitomaculum sp.]